MFRVIVLTLFPEMFPGPLGQSLAGQALEKGLWSLEVVNIRDFAEDRHKTVDSPPYGGGTGMVFRADVLEKAIEYAKKKLPEAELLYTSPRGKVLNQVLVKEIVANDLIILCGRFEGVDQRLLEHYNFKEISLGDFILSGGEIAAYALLDASLRLLPGVISKESALDEESFTNNCRNDNEFAGLLEYPHYTRPSFWQGKSVPDVLLSGHHEAIRQWRLEQAKAVTSKRRPDLWDAYQAEAHVKNKE